MDGGDRSSNWVALLLLSLAIASVGVAAILRSRGGRRKSSGSRPGILEVARSVMEFHRNKHRLLEYNTEMLKAVPGHTITTGLYVMTADPANVEHILKTNFDNYPKGEFLNGNLREMLGDGIFNADDERWKIQRKVASPEFSTRSIRDLVLESVVRETARIFPILSSRVGGLEGEPQNPPSLDMQDIFTRFAIDNICQVALGVDPGCLDSSLPDVEFATAFDQATSSSLQKIQTFPKILWRVQQAFNVGQAKELRDAVRVIDEFAMRVIRNRRNELASGREGIKADLLSRFMSLVDEGQQEDTRRSSSSSNAADYERKWTEDHKSGHHSNSFSDLFLRDMIISFVMAGRDTSTAALSWFFWVLLEHPNVEVAIVDEISRVQNSRSPEVVAREGRQSPFSFEELKNMHYLHAALSESIRLYPPVPINFKTAKRVDVWPDGTVIAPGTIVGYHPYAMGRMENLWGKDCMEYKPERWLNKDGMFVPRSPFVYTAFHAGPRFCLGKDMVMLQMKVICTAIISNFELSLPEGYEAQLLPTSLTLRLKDGLPVRVRHRTSPGMKF